MTLAAAPVNWELIVFNGDPRRSGTGLQMNKNTTKNYLPANFPGSRACRVVKQRGVAAKPHGAASGVGLGAAACGGGGTGAMPCPSPGRDGHQRAGMDGMTPHRGGAQHPWQPAAACPKHPVSHGHAQTSHLPPPQPLCPR